MAKFIAINSEFGRGTRNIHGPRGSLTSSMGPEYGRASNPNPAGRQDSIQEKVEEEERRARWRDAAGNNNGRGSGRVT